MVTEILYDVIIIGAGPSGGFVAKILAEHKASVALVEQHQTIGHPVHCAGLVSPRIFEMFGIPSEQIIQNNIKKANIHSPGGQILTIGGDKIQAYRIDRARFDMHLVNEAKKNGVSLFTHEKVLSIQKSSQNIDVETSSGLHIKSKIVVGADGPYSRVRDVFGFSQPKELLRGVGAQLLDTNLQGSTVEIFVGTKVAPGFFAWMIPTNQKGTKAHVGLCIQKNSSQPPMTYLRNLFLNPFSSNYLSDAVIEYQTGGVIPIGPLEKTSDERVLLVGDAAAQVKPTSGGGIYPGLLCARHCANTIYDALCTQQYDAMFFQKYHDAWRKDIGKELSRGMYFRKLFTRLSDEHFDKYIKKFQQDPIKEIIYEYGDIDYPSKLVKPLLKKTPSLLRLLPQFVQ